MKEFLWILLANYKPKVVKYYDVELDTWSCYEIDDLEKSIARYQTDPIRVTYYFNPENFTLYISI